MALTAREIKQRYFDKRRAEASTIKCACGCGQDLQDTDLYGRPQDYINGHNARKYHGKDGTLWAAEQRWRAKNKDKLRVKKRNYYRKRKLMAIEILGNKCETCGVAYNGTNAPIFDFHHKDPSKKKDMVSRMLINKAWSKTLKEIEKCALLCANCHNQYHGGEW